MLLNRENIIKVLQNEKLVLQNDFGIKSIALFGSYAKNKQNETSDIDFIIEQKEVSYTNLIKALVFIEKKFPGKTVQLTRKGPHLSQKFLNTISNDLIYV